MLFLNHEALSVSSTVVRPTAAQRGSANYAFITCDTAPVRYRVDGGVPTATTGHKLPVDGVLELEDESELLAFSVIAESTSATLRISYGRKG